MIFGWRVSIVAIASLAPSTCALAQNRIVPGQSAGQIRLGETIANVRHKLGKAETGDGALDHFWDTWFANSNKKTGDTLEIYSVRTPSGDEILVNQIRLTSPWFATANGILPRSSLALIRRRFPLATALAYYQAKSDRIDVYDDVKSGISFEVSHKTKKCIAITIHKKNKKVTDIYARRHDYKFPPKI